jgi:unsaturated chondroitin disaccharide hydrolase
MPHVVDNRILHSNKENSVIDTTHQWATIALQKASAHVTTLAEELGAAFLHATLQGRYTLHDADEWTSGFWPGMLLLVYAHTNNRHLLELAAQAESELEQAIIDERFYGLHHDVGFQFFATAVTRYRLTADPVARRRGLLAANLLMGRFNPVGGFLEAWNAKDRRGMIIIDTMMNLPLLYWAAAEFKQPRFRHVADSHARIALRHFIRSEGAVHHIVRFDQQTGQPIEPLGGQGYAPFSCWARGQTWALYGFTMAYRYTGTLEYLTAARQVADHFLSLLPPTLVPPWDFFTPAAEQEPRDSSAGAIAASGLLDLARLLPAGEGESYTLAAFNLLQALHEHCAPEAASGHQGLLLHATGNLPKGLNIDVSLIYGDFYYLEALCKCAGLMEHGW